MLQVVNQISFEDRLSPNVHVHFVAGIFADVYAAAGVAELSEAHLVLLVCGLLMGNHKAGRYSRHRIESNEAGRGTDNSVPINITRGYDSSRFVPLQTRDLHQIRCDVHALKHIWLPDIRAAINTQHKAG